MEESSKAAGPLAGQFHQEHGGELERHADRLHAEQDRHIHPVMDAHLIDAAGQHDQNEQPNNISGKIGCQFTDDMERVEYQHQGERQQFQREFQKPHIMSRPFLFPAYSLPRRPAVRQGCRVCRGLFISHILKCKVGCGIIQLDKSEFGKGRLFYMKDWQKLIGAVIIALAILGASLILADAIRYLGEAINAGLVTISNRF